MTIKEIVDAVRTNSVLIPDIPSSEGLPPMVFGCSASNDGAGIEECNAVADGHCPTDLKQFWHLTRTAKLCEDVTYHDWGLEIFSLEVAHQQTGEFKKEREGDAIIGDLIVGRLIGGSELLLIRTNPKADDFGSVILAGPIDPRQNWDKIARSFGEFLNRYIEARGDMYWTKKS